MVSRNDLLSFDNLYQNLFDECFVFNSFKSFSKSVLLSVDIKNISSINLRYINENALKNGYTGFLSRWSINMFVYEGAKIVPMVQSFICK